MIAYGKRNTWLVREIEGAFHMPLERLLFRKYYRERKTCSEIADELGCSGSTISRYMIECGFNLRTVGFEYAEAHEAELIMRAQRVQAEPKGKRVRDRATA